MRMKRSGLMIIGLCLVLTVGLVLVNFNQASFKVSAANEKASKNASSFISEGITYDLLAGTTSGATISGNLADKKSRAVVGEEVTLLGKASKRGGKKVEELASTTTNSLGQYQFSVSNDGRYSVKVGKKKGRVRVKQSDIDDGNVIIKNLRQGGKK